MMIVRIGGRVLISRLHKYDVGVLVAFGLLDV